jgi:hypothetical protein
MSGEREPRPLAHFRLAPHLLAGGNYRITINLSGGQEHGDAAEPIAIAVRRALKELALPGSVRTWVGGVDTKVTVHFIPAALNGLDGRIRWADHLVEACLGAGIRPRSLWLLPFEFAEGSLFQPKPATRAGTNLRAVLERRHAPDWQRRFISALARDEANESVRRPELAYALSAQMSPAAEAVARRAIDFVSTHPFHTGFAQWPAAETGAMARWLETEGWLAKVALDGQTAYTGPLARTVKVAGYVPVYSDR